MLLARRLMTGCPRLMRAIFRITPIGRKPWLAKPAGPFLLMKEVTAHDSAVAALSITFSVGTYFGNTNGI